MSGVGLLIGRVLIVISFAVESKSYSINKEA